MLRLAVLAFVVFYFADEIKDWGMLLAGIIGSFMFWVLVIACAIWLAVGH